MLCTIHFQIKNNYSMYEVCVLIKRNSIKHNKRYEIM